MFMTQRQEEVYLGKVFEGEQYWKTVELPLSQPFLYVTVSFVEYSGVNSRVYMLSGVRELEKLLCEQWLFHQVSSVMLVSPPELNGGEHSQMELLTEIRQAQDREKKSSFSLIYELEDGRQYIHGECTDPARLVDDCVIFSAANLPTQKP